MKKLVIVLIIAMFVVSAAAVAFANPTAPSQDVVSVTKKVAHKTKRGTKQVYHRTKVGGKWVYKKGKKGTKWTYHKVKRGGKWTYVKTRNFVVGKPKRVN